MLSSLFSDPLGLVGLLIAFLAALTFHEFSHGLVAKMLGDDTAERMGRLTLNPIPHIDPIGLLAVLVAGFGWAKPVPYNPYNLRDQKWGPVMVAAAGPLSNLLFFLVVGLAYKGIAAAGFLAAGSPLDSFLQALMYINVVLFAFNLIPIPPLDGSKVLLLALQHPKYAKTRYWLETQGPTLLIVAILVDSFILNGMFFGTIIGVLSGFAFRLLGL
ncbi:MAG TPA: site-2 protease family protein [Candidatus Eisenbacteria bacterium]|nr:site-2 protease family protein [Candidatus Eisenbacteria bacterium]